MLNILLDMPLICRRVKSSPDRESIKASVKNHQNKGVRLDTKKTYQNKVMETLFERRSIRKYLDKQLDPDALEAIVEAGLRAPSAGGAQSPMFVVCQNKEANLLLGQLSHDLYNEGYYPVSKAQPSTADDPNNIDGFYGAPCVVHSFTPKDYEYAPFDAAMSACYMMLAAWSFDIGSCFISRAKRLFDTDEGRSFASQHNVPSNYEGAFHLCLGYPSDLSRSAKPIYQNRLQWVH